VAGFRHTITSPLPDDRLLTIEDVAARLRVSERKVSSLVAEGKLRAIKIGSCLRFDPEAVDAYIRSSVARKPTKRRK